MAERRQSAGRRLFVGAYLLGCGGEGAVVLPDAPLQRTSPVCLCRVQVSSLN